MRTNRYRVIFNCILAAITWGVPAFAQSDGWRIALGGGRITGYLGLLANHGLHRRVLSDAELADIDVLRRYAVVIVTTPVANPQAVTRAIEQYVAEGGCAITEYPVAPSPQALQGRRIGPAPCANITFEGIDHPISRTMHGTGVVVTVWGKGLAILPAGGQDVAVIARFTDEGVPQKFRGRLTGGRRDLPALLLFTHGEGQWLFCGAPVSFTLALRGFELQPALLEALRIFSEGVLVPRFVTLDPTRRLLPRVQWEPETQQAPRRWAPRGTTPADLPSADPPFEALELSEQAPEDFLIVGDLTPDTPVELLLPWYSPDWHRRLTVKGERIRLVEVGNGREQLLAEGTLPPINAMTELAVRRRPHSVTVFVGGRVVLSAAMEPMAGVFASRGLGDAYLQECAPVVFADNFMRTEDAPKVWETPAGSWKLYRVEGEPEQGSNPFAFRAEQGERAVAVAGYDFWDDYDFAASVRPQARAVEIMAHWRADNDNVALRLWMPEDDLGALLELVRRTPEGERVLASAPVQAEPDRWHRLRLRISRGRVVAGLNGRDVLVAADDLLRGRGRIGLQVLKGSAFFDDVEVAAWEATPLPAPGGTQWRVERGTLRAQGDTLTLVPAGTARALAPTAEQADVQASAAMRLNKADQVGLLLRYRSPGDHYEIGLAREGRRVVLRVLKRHRGNETVLAQMPMKGGPKRWHDITARLRGRDITVFADGEPALRVADEAYAVGGFGVACAGGEASVRDAVCWPIENLRFRADPPTPPYAGIIDVHTWAGAGSGWLPTPADPDMFWHRGLFADDVEIRLGVHRAPDGAASASLTIGDGVDAAGGWVARAEQSSLNDPVRVRLLRAGQEVASGEARVRSGEGYALSLQRVGSLIVAAVNGEAVCEYRDAEPRASWQRVGFRRDAAVVDPADVEIISPTVHTWTFERAPAEWWVESGTWEISNRWSCSPEWTWLAGWNQNGPARILTRQSFVGDQTIDIYVGTKMMPKPEGSGHYEELRDLHFGLCEDGTGGGYRIVLGARGNTWSAILRNGEPVVTNNYQIPQAERHNNWLLVTLVKEGATISVRVWDREVLSFTDKEPIAGGKISVGTERNGITVPRVTVYGTPAE